MEEYKTQRSEQLKNIETHPHKWDVGISIQHFISKYSYLQNEGSY